MKQRRPSLPADQFVREYMKAYKLNLSFKELAVRLNYSTQNVVSRTEALKKRGVRLPKLKASERGRKLDIDQLNEIIKKGDY